jgi:TIGR02594 family protein
MIAFDRKAFFDAVRPLFGGRLTQAQVDSLSIAIDAGLGVIHQTGPVISEPPWVTIARRDIGLQEIPGKQHASRIIQMLKLLKYSISDDETPWCATAMAAWMTEAGLTPPPYGYRAKSWADWGVECRPQVGAIGVKSRVGGGHVFLIVGETPDKRCFKALGANQRNAVNIMDVLKSDVSAGDIRWPPGVPLLNLPLPVMSTGTLSKDEA